MFIVPRFSCGAHVLPDAQPGSGGQTQFQQEALQETAGIGIGVGNDHGVSMRGCPEHSPGDGGRDIAQSSALGWGLLLLGSVAGTWVAWVHDLHITAIGPVVCGLAVGGLQFRVRSDERLITLAAEVDLPVLSKGRCSKQHDGE
jgi:hypothetical protein